MKLRVLAVLLSIILITVFILSFLFQDNLTAVISQEARYYGLFFIFFITALLDFIPQYMAPHFVMLNAGILGFSKFPLIILTMLGSTFGALFGFELGRIYGYGLICKFYSVKDIKSLEAKVNKYGKGFVFIAALSPLPYIPIIFGSLNFRRKNFIYYGLLPRAVGILGFGLVFL